MATSTVAAKTFPKGVVKVTELLTHLAQHPRLKLASNVKALRLSLAAKNDHWGARHFIKTDLPRIRYSNPDLAIEVTKWPKSEDESWRPEIEILLENEQRVALDMNNKLASSILTVLMDTHGGEPWKAASAIAQKAGKSVIPQEVLKKEAKQTSKAKTKPPSSENTPERLPNLTEFWKAHPGKREAHLKALQERRETREKRKEQAAKSSPGTTDRNATEANTPA